MWAGRLERRGREWGGEDEKWMKKGKGKGGKARE